MPEFWIPWLLAIEFTLLGIFREQCQRRSKAPREHYLFAHRRQQLDVYDVQVYRSIPHWSLILEPILSFRNCLKGP